MRLKSDLVDLVDAALDARLDRVRAEWDPGPALGVVMAAIMAAIGVFGGAPTGLVGRLFDAGNDSDHWLWMALAFALPPIARVALSIIGRATDRRSHDLKAHQRLTLLSLSAATGAIIGLVVHPVAGLAVISLALGIYLFAFIFKPSLGRGTVHEALWGTPGED